MGEKRLVGRHHMLAAGDRRFANGLGDAVGTADEFDHDLGPGLGRHRHRVVVPLHAVEIDAAIASLVARRDGTDDDRPAAALSQHFAMGLQ